MKNTHLAIAFLACLAPVVLGGCNRGDASPIADAVAEAVPVPVQFRMPARADLYATYTTTANLDTEGDAPAVARVDGEVVELLVEEGTRVVAGQALARLDGERLRLEMQAARAELGKVQGEYDRYRGLHDRGLVSKASYDNLKFDLDALAATYELRQLDYGYATLRAPIDGFVAAREIRPGQNLRTGDVAFRITDARELVAELQLPQTELRRIDAGQDATVKVDSLPGREFAATIVRISPTIDGKSGTFRATTRIPNASGQLAPGMFARFSIAYERHPDALVIPAAALIEEDEQTAVYVVSGEMVERRIIETGIEADGGIEVLAGLSEEDRVVVSGHASLRDGSKVLARIGNPNNHSG